MCARGGTAVDAGNGDDEFAYDELLPTPPGKQQQPTQQQQVAAIASAAATHHPAAGLLAAQGAHSRRGLLSKVLSSAAGLLEFEDAA
jgi:hypothetical protein